MNRPQRSMLERIARQDGTILVTEVVTNEWARRTLKVLIALDLVELCSHPTVKEGKDRHAAALRLTGHGKELALVNPGVVLSVPVPAVPGSNPVTWARAFLAINPTSETLTEETLVTWFGNALRRGYEIGLTQEKRND